MRHYLIKSLPPLPLDKNTTHITQEMADRILDYLVEHYPDCMEKVAMYERGYTDGNTISTYHEAMCCVIQNIGKIMDVPDSELGYIELNFELVRRCRAFYNFEIPQVCGKPLAPSIDGPYPEKLIEKPIFCDSVFKAGFTQEQIDAWGDEFYENNKEICFERAEALRREVASNYLKRNPIGVYFRQKAEETGNEKIIRYYSQASSEFVSRISLTCNTITQEMLREIQERWNNSTERTKH